MTKARWIVKADRTRCMGSGMCVVHAPNTFDVDDELRVVVLETPGDDLAAVKAAVEGCPTRALRFEEADDTEAGGDSSASH